MQDYNKLVESLRLIGKEQDCNECEAGKWHRDINCCLFEDAAAAIEALEAKVADYEDTLKWHQKEFAELRAMIDDANARLEVGKAGNQYTLIEPKNKRYTLRCPKCGTVVGLMEVQE